ncbi:MAG: hypothetical protein KAX49_09530 [Halanaerobiales bacterium]|nr:hypothetical protein [Halanaerobiales bacterium]
MKFVADFYTQTVANGHAFSTIQENIQTGVEKRLKYVAITEHGPTFPDGPHPYYFGNFRVVPTVMKNLNVLRGVELNIQDTLGTVDLPAETIYDLDLVLAGLHRNTGYEGKAIQENTEAIINAIFNPLIDIIIHSDYENYPIDISTVVRVAKENNTLLGVNNSFFVKNQADQKNSYNYYKKVLEEAMDQELVLAFGSGSHFSSDVGNFDLVFRLIEDVKFPLELMLNVSEDRVEEFINQRNKHREKIDISRY